MTPQQLVGLALRLFAIWLCITSIAYFTSIPAAMQSSNLQTSTLIPFVIGGAHVLVALVLWFFPMLCAAGLLPRTRHENTFKPQPSELARVGCALMGLWLFSKALPNLVWFVFRAFLIADATSAASTLPSDTKLEITVALFEVIFAVVIIAKAQWFARLIEPARAEAITREDGSS